MAVVVNKTKDPDEDLDYTWDYESLLATDEELVSYEFHDVPEAIELHDEAMSDTAVTAYVGPGGTVGNEYVVSCKVVTSATPPRTFDRSIRFKMVTK